MVRYRLRTLSIFVAVAPIVLAAAWHWWEGSEFGPHRSDTEIRTQLLKHTPLNTKAEDVLKFILKGDAPRRSIHAYWNYWQYVRPTRANEHLPYPNQREISAIVGSRSVGFFRGDEDVRAIWHFDENNRLTDIAIDRFSVFP